MLEALKRASVMLSKYHKISFREQRENIQERTGKSIGHDVIYRVATEETNIRNRKDGLADDIYDYLIDSHKAVLQEALLEVCSGQANSVDRLASIIVQFLGVAEEYDLSSAAKISGTYSAYRPHFLEDGSIMVMRLKCGSEDHASVFKMEMRYTSPLGTESIEKVAGSIIPYEGNALFLGKIDGTGAPFIFIMSKFAKSEGVYAHAQGAVMVGSSGSLPTASAMLIVRNDDPPVPCVLPRSEAETLPNWNHINQVLSRGLVSWKL